MKHSAFLPSCHLRRLVSPVRRALLALVTVGAVLALALGARAQIPTTFTVLHSFDGSADGFFPASPLVEGADGNFYGTTRGGASTPSTVYQITPSGTLTTLHTFGAPSVIFEHSALLVGSDGNFYGTTINDGANGFGTVFQITPAGVFTDLHDFTSSEGYEGYGPLLQGSDGNFYGTNYYGGAFGYGTVYQLTPAGVLTVFVNFNKVTGSFYPNSGLVQGSDGNFYCTLSLGTYSTVTGVVKITPAGALTALYNIPEGTTSGAYQTSLAQGTDGDFYGTTSALFQDNAYASLGTVFQINPSGTFKTLFSFTADSNGSNPVGPLIQAEDGNIYGTTRGTEMAGGDNSLGTVFQVTTSGTLTTLHTFAGNDGEGANGLVQGRDRSFYGTNAYGGISNGGTIYKLTVTTHPAFFAGEVSLGDGAYYLAFPDGTRFGYYSYLTDPNYIYHFDLGYEYVFDADDGNSGIYLYDFASDDFFYTSRTFPYPYLYDFSLNTVLYYYPDPNNLGHYTSNPRYFYDFATQTIITK